MSGATFYDCINTIYQFIKPFHTPPHDRGGVLWFHLGCLCVCPSVCPSVVCPSVSFFSFPDDNLSKHQWIFTKLGMCIDIVEIWFGIANGQISSNFMELPARSSIMAGYYSFNVFIWIMKCLFLRDMESLTLSHLSLCNGLFHIWIWTFPLLQICVSIKKKRE